MFLSIKSPPILCVLNISAIILKPEHYCLCFMLNFCDIFSRIITKLTTAQDDAKLTLGSQFRLSINNSSNNNNHSNNSNNNNISSINNVIISITVIVVLI